jgi:hypothetical protein
MAAWRAAAHLPAVVAQQVHKVDGGRIEKNVLHVEQHSEQHATCEVPPLGHERHGQDKQPCVQDSAVSRRRTENSLNLGGNHCPSCPSLTLHLLLFVPQASHATTLARLLPCGL